MNLKSKAVFLLALTAAAFGAQEVAQINGVNTKDWKTFASKDEKFSLRAPKEWGNGDPTDISSKETIERIRKNNPAMAKMLATQDKTFLLYMFDFSDDPATGLNNLNVKALKDSGLTAAMYPDVAVQVLEVTKMKKASWKVIDLPAGKTLFYTGDLPFALDEKTNMEFKVYGYLIVKDNVTYICTMMTTPAKDKGQKPIFEAIAKTIVLK